ncbi:hypothetical protein PGT21_018797 [Puccinia graminis f. sp. tritici]|uniref:Uncharacterized protein n=1 Tax=Puccinia graminis f. sp. tritici TaxID=56615 RepID=A0A5B0RM84_PUCGR|nr:hypothetical protein PGT21_018797 [Puccinia graminis f. sp. tritici]KAA1126950.1 hypothetical protein PGTUg99_033369 [Puccinia graminis f. sp. tritici]
MQQGSRIPPSIPTTNNYELRIRYLEETVGLLLAKKENHLFPSVSSTPLGGLFRYSIDRGLVPLLSKTTANRSRAPNHANLPRDHPEFISGFSQVTGVEADEIIVALHTFERSSIPTALLRSFAVLRLLPIIYPSLQKPPEFASVSRASLPHSTETAALLASRPSSRNNNHNHNLIPTTSNCSSPIKPTMQSCTDNFDIAAVGSLTVMDENALATLERQNDPRYCPIEDSEFVPFEDW